MHRSSWPTFDPALAADESVTLVVQVDGKVRDKLEVPADISEADALAAAHASAGREPSPGRPGGSPGDRARAEAREPRHPRVAAGYDSRWNARSDTSITPLATRSNAKVTDRMCVRSTPVKSAKREPDLVHDEVPARTPPPGQLHPEHIVADVGRGQRCLRAVRVLQDDVEVLEVGTVVGVVARVHHRAERQDVVARHVARADRQCVADRGVARAGRRPAEQALLQPGADRTEPRPGPMDVVAAELPGNAGRVIDVRTPAVDAYVRRRDGAAELAGREVGGAVESRDDRAGSPGRRARGSSRPCVRA